MEIFLIIHVVAVVVGMGTALSSDALFNFYSRDKVLSKSELYKLTLFSKIVWASLWLIVLSGIGIFLTKPLIYLASAKFLSKMSIVFIIIINGYLLARVVQPHLNVPKFLTSPKEKRVRKIAFACGAISLLSWLSAFTLAILKNITYTYVEIMTVYVILLVVGVVIALMVENKKSRG